MENRRTTRGRRRGVRLLAVTLAAMLVAACAPPPTGGGGGQEYDLGPLTVPLPPLGTTPPPVTVPLLGLCEVGYQAPAVTVPGGTVTIPSVRIDPSAATVTVPDVSVDLPGTRLGLPAVTLSCLGLLSISTRVDLIVPATARVGAAVIDLQRGTLVLAQPSLTVRGVGLGFPGLGDLVIPLPPLTLPLPSVTIPLDDAAPAGTQVMASSG